MGDLLCIGSCSGKLFALDRRDGRLRWSRDVRPNARPTSFHGDPFVANGVIVIGTDAGTQDNRLNYVWAFDADNGIVRWKYPLEDGIVSDIVSDGTRAFAITREDSLLCLDLATGGLLWSFTDSIASEAQFVYRSPAAAGGRVFLRDAEGRIHALAAETGRLLWTRSLRAEVSTGVLAIGDQLVLADVRGTVYRLDQTTGATRGALQGGSIFHGPPVALGDSLVLLSGDDAIVCADLIANGVKWRHDLRVSTSRPYEWKGAALAATANGDLVAFRSHDGRPLWTRAFTGVIRGIGHDDSTLFLGTQEGMLYAYRP